MASYCKYVKRVQEVSYDNGVTWKKVVPEVTELGTLIECNSPDCGFIEPQSRWVNLDPSTDFVCQNQNKYYKQKKQWSYDGGLHWVDSDPIEYQQGDMYEPNSYDCDYGVTWKTVPDKYYCENVDEDGFILKTLSENKHVNLGKLPKIAKQTITINDYDNNYCLIAYFYEDYSGSSNAKIYDTDLNLIYDINFGVRFSPKGTVQMSVIKKNQIIHILCEGKYYRYEIANNTTTYVYSIARPVGSIIYNNIWCENNILYLTNGTQGSSNEKPILETYLNEIGTDSKVLFDKYTMSNIINNYVSYEINYCNDSTKTNIKFYELPNKNLYLEENITSELFGYACSNDGIIRLPFNKFMYNNIGVFSENTAYVFNKGKYKFNKIPYYFNNGLFLINDNYYTFEVENTSSSTQNIILYKYNIE